MVLGRRAAESVPLACWIVHVTKVDARVAVSKTRVVNCLGIKPKGQNYELNCCHMLNQFRLCGHDNLYTVHVRLVKSPLKV